MDANFSSQLEGTSIRLVPTAAAVLVLTIAFAFAILATPAVQAQSDEQPYLQIHNFTNGLDGGLPNVGLTIDAAGNLYGTTPNGGIFTGQCSPFGCGVVYQLKVVGSKRVFTPLYSFAGGSDGNYSDSRVAIGQDGNLYGTTVIGGGEGSCYYSGSGCGTVFRLKASLTGKWNETVLYRFTGGSDGGEPLNDLVFDQSGNIYGVTLTGGATNNGVIYKLKPSQGSWTETVLYSAQNNGDGANPTFIVRDKSGHLYGVFSNGGPHGWGAVFRLSPSTSGWTEQTLHGFSGGSDGKNPISLIIDGAGNLYGTTRFGGSLDCGTVFKLMPANGHWIFSTLHSFGNDHEGCFSQSALVMDATGNLYGTLVYGGEYLWGAVFKLTAATGWSYTSLHDFTGNDGNFSTSRPVFDASGNLYGTAQFGGTHDRGVLFEILP